MNFGDRWDSHISLLRNNKHKNKHLQSAWNLYGEDSFEFIVIHDLQDGEDINKLEISYIAKYKELGISYNMCDGGEGGSNRGKHLSEETKRKIGEKNRINMLGFVMPQETKNKISEANKRKWKSLTEEEKAMRMKNLDHNKGMKRSKEAREKMSNNQRTKPNGATHTMEEVLEIRKMYEIDKMTVTEIANKTNNLRAWVDGIVKYRRWANI